MCRKLISRGRARLIVAAMALLFSTVLVVVGMIIGHSQEPPTKLFGSILSFILEVVLPCFGILLLVAAIVLFGSHYYRPVERRNKAVTDKWLTWFVLSNVFFGILLIFVSRVREIELTLVGKIKTRAENAEKLEERIETIANEMQFTLDMVKARNGDRESFERIRQRANADDPARQAAIEALYKALDPYGGFQFSKGFPWEEVGIDLESVSLDELRSFYFQFGHGFEIDFLYTVEGMKRFGITERLDFLCDIVKDMRTNPTGLAAGCRLLESHAHINGSGANWEAYIDWWERNRAKYKLPTPTTTSPAVKGP